MTLVIMMIADIFILLNYCMETGQTSTCHIPSQVELPQSIIIIDVLVF